MIKDKEMKDRVNENQSEILFAIKERINGITNRNNCEPINLKGIEVIDTSGPFSGAVKYFEIQNIFIDERGDLYGDFLGKDESLTNEIIFGRSIKDLYYEDLKKILDSLYSEDWSINKDCNNMISHRREGLHEALINKYLGMKLSLIFSRIVHGCTLFYRGMNEKQSFSK